jgi:hypothetical protein
MLTSVEMIQRIARGQRSFAEIRRILTRADSRRCEVRRSGVRIPSAPPISLGHR